MSITVEELASRLAAEAARRGITVEALLDELADKLPPARRKLGFVGLGSSVSTKRAFSRALTSSASGRDSGRLDEMLAEGFGRSRSC